jgi:chromosome segregation ATPase
MPAVTMKTDTKKIEIIPNVTKIVGDKTPGASTDTAREELEQRRTILQNMKDFDFQIKKNQEDLTNLNEKVENLSKDLDDLVSLYEIVSEQMNPFVGLSKVTKKRIDALENFTKEVDNVKNRIGDLESLFEKSRLSADGNVRTIPVLKPTKEEKTGSEKPKETTATPVPTPSSISSIPVKPINEIKTTSYPNTPVPISIPIQPTSIPNLSDKEIDELLSRSLESLLIEQNIDNMINEFFLSLK